MDDVACDTMHIWLEMYEILWLSLVEPYTGAEEAIVGNKLLAVSIVSAKSLGRARVWLFVVDAPALVLVVGTSLFVLREPVEDGFSSTTSFVRFIVGRDIVDSGRTQYTAWVVSCWIQLASKNCALVII